MMIRIELSKKQKKLILLLKAKNTCEIVTKQKNALIAQ